MFITSASYFTIFSVSCKRVDIFMYKAIKMWPGGSLLSPHNAFLPSFVHTAHIKSSHSVVFFFFGFLLLPNSTKNPTLSNPHGCFKHFLLTSYPSDSFASLWFFKLYDWFSISVPVTEPDAKVEPFTINYGTFMQSPQESGMEVSG